MTLLAREELARAAPGRPSAVTVGVFDGVHRGHVHIIEHVKERARELGLASGVITLHPDPVQVLRPDQPIAYLTSLEERIELLRATEVDFVAPLTFTSDVAELSAREFVELLVSELQMRLILMGPDHAFGRGREGTPERLRELGTELGFAVEMLPEPLRASSGPISATAIRRALADGDMETVIHYLGRPYALHGPVVHGAHRGKTIGFPTANIAVAPDRAVPAFGVYVTRAYVNEVAYQSVTNVGQRPTFDAGERTVETFLLDFQGELYGRLMRVEFLHRLRPEIKFASVDDLVAQIRRDVEATREFFA